MAKLAAFVKPEVGQKIRVIQNRAWVPKSPATAVTARGHLDASRAGTALAPSGVSRPRAAEGGSR